MLDALLAEARDDDNVVGIVLFGSRGKGAFVTEASDWGSLTWHGCGAMRKGLLALVLLSAGCGRTYTGTDVQQALGTSSPASMGSYIDPARTVFATSAAVTNLVIEETPPLPQEVYNGSDIFVWRYRNSHEASLAMHAPGRTLLIIVQQRDHIVTRREANLVLIGESRRVEATLARLH